MPRARLQRRRAARQRSRSRRKRALARSIERARGACAAVSTDAAQPVIARLRGAFLFHDSRLRTSRGRMFDRRLFQSCHV
ncbi:hypothetical protein DB771_28865 [Burkholderia sp. AU29985]|nr:hypothetical protein EGY28_27435 [Burkholderia dolosa]PRE45950.1 hypothetical protein C6P87_19660 [Burkholderia sp. AU12872]PUA73540.1 hypothetical protein DB771_28865 [Burkholderia sp. AU29985]